MIRRRLSACSFVHADGRPCRNESNASGLCPPHARLTHPGRVSGLSNAERMRRHRAMARSTGG